MTAVSARPEPTEPDVTESSSLRRWLGLVVLSLSQLMIVLDATVVNVAMPTITAELHVSEADRQWIVTAYLIAFGGLLLLGGRIADYLGRKRAFLIGLFGFAGASVLGGFANDLWVLLLARAAQGACAALLAPAGLALLSVTFTEARERGIAFAVYGATASAGNAIGLILGGVLTEYLDWRWTLWINIPIAIATALCAIPLLIESRRTGRTTYDVPGAVLATAGLVAIVYGFSEAERNGWSATFTVALLVGGVLLMCGFVVVEARVRDPLLPLRIVRHRSRGGANLAMLLVSIALWGTFLIMTFYMQGVLGYSPVQTGLAFLPFTGGVLLAMPIAGFLAPRVPPRYLVTVGAIAAAVQLFLVTQVEVGSSFFEIVFPAMLVGGFSLGMVFIPTLNCATIGVEPGDAGVAGAAINTAQQIGGALGAALLNTIAADRAAGYLEGRIPDPATALQAQVEGYNRAGVWGMVIAIVAAVITYFLIDARRLDSVSIEIAPPPDELSSVRSEVPSEKADRVHHERWAVTSVAVSAVDGVPVAGAALTLLTWNGNEKARSVTDPMGLAGLDAEPGEYILVTRTGGYRPDAARVQIQPASRCQIRVVLEADEPAPGSRGRVYGVAVSGAEERPVRDAFVTLVSPDGTIIATTVADSAGRYEFDHVPAGDYTLIAAGYQESVDRVSVPDGGSLDHTVRLRHPELLTGTIHPSSALGSSTA